MNLPKVLVGCPTSDYKSYCLKEYINAVKNLSYKNYDILLVDNSKDDGYLKEIRSYGIKAIKSKYYEGAKDRIIMARNVLREKCLEGNYNYLFSLEQDVIPPRDIIERLLKHKKEIVSALYFYLGDDKKTLLPMAWVHLKGEYARRLTFSEVYYPKFIEVITAGLGCILIKNNVLKKVKFRHVKGEKPFDDLWFCEDARKNGFKVYLDTSVKCKHLNKGDNWKNIKL